MDFSFPDSPEAVALLLFAMLLDQETPLRNDMTVSWSLDLFAECVKAVRGQRCQEDQRRH